MTRRTAQARYVSRADAGCIDFDAALEAYLDGGDPEELLRAASLVIGSIVLLDPEYAWVIQKVTGADCELMDYDDAGRAVRSWFALMGEPGARH
jgi:hypothetical protein